MPRLCLTLTLRWRGHMLTAMRGNALYDGVIDRRGLLKAGLGTGLLLLDPEIKAQAQASRQIIANPTFTSDPFTLGIASGEPAPDGFVIWTRLAPRPLAPAGIRTPRIAVNWEIARDDQMRDVVRNGVAVAHVEVAHCVHVEVEDLEPSRDYFYRFRAGEATSPIGRARTLPTAGAKVDQMRFASSGCQSWEGGHYTAWRRIAEENFDFVYHYGDYIYEYAAFAKYRDGRIPVRAMPQNFGVCRTLTDYRFRYSLYKTDPDLQAAHASCPFLPIFDDHEITDNWASDSDPANTPKELFWFRRAAAFQAWYEHMPVRARLMPRGPDITAYRKFSVGSLADIHVLDTRQYRSHQPCGDGFRPVCSDARAPDRSMMGETQESWLGDNLKSNGGIWSVLAQQVLFSNLDLDIDPTREVHDMDAWDGAPAARDRALAAWRNNHVANPIVLSGDLHRAIAADICEDAKDPASKCVAVEFLPSSISSTGETRDPVLVSQSLRSKNPHLKYFGAEHGYVRHTVTPTQWRADYRAIPSIEQPGGEVVTRQSFVVEAGRPGLVEA